MEAPSGDELRLMCPHCETVWSTTSVPSECPTCASIVTIRLVRRAKRK